MVTTKQQTFLTLFHPSTSKTFDFLPLFYGFNHRVKLLTHFAAFGLFFSVAVNCFGSVQNYTIDRIEFYSLAVSVKDECIGRKKNRTDG